MFGAASPVLAADATVYTGVTILDPVTQRRLPDHYIVVRGERIEAMGQGLVPERYIGAIRSDMRGRFAMPGLFDTLFSQTGDQDPIELSANSGDVFVIPDGDARITFTRDASGAIAGLILHQDGRDWIASKS